MSYHYAPADLYEGYAYDASTQYSPEVYYAYNKDYSYDSYAAADYAAPDYAYDSYAYAYAEYNDSYSYAYDKPVYAYSSTYSIPDAKQYNEAYNYAYAYANDYAVYYSYAKPAYDVYYDSAAYSTNYLYSNDYNYSKIAATSDASLDVMNLVQVVVIMTSVYFASKAARSSQKLN